MGFCFPLLVTMLHQICRVSAIKNLMGPLKKKIKKICLKVEIPPLMTLGTLKCLILLLNALKFNVKLKLLNF
jgi:hypothetical protein